MTSGDHNGTRSGSDWRIAGVTSRMEMESTNRDLNTLFPFYERGEEPLVTVEQLKRDVEKVIGSGDDLP